jgi:MerR family transcriptional regulator, light-induced transcriptional regulator
VMAWAIAAAVRSDGVVAAWDDLICPVLTGVGERHAATRQLVEVEHLLSRTVAEVLAAIARPTARPARVLLACADDEQHSLPIEALAAALAERGVGTRVLGARTPPAALQAAVRRTGPTAVFVWSQAPDTADPAQLRGLLALRPRPVVIAAVGPGWGEVPAGVVRPESLSDALSTTLDVV